MSPGAPASRSPAGGGERDALAANVLFGVGAAALVASAVLSYFDYQRTRPAEASPKSAGLKIGPGAVQLDLTF